MGAVVAERPPIPPFRAMLLQGTDSTVLLLRRDAEEAVHFSEYELVGGGVAH